MFCLVVFPSSFHSSPFALSSITSFSLYLLSCLSLLLFFFFCFSMFLSLPSTPLGFFVYPLFIIPIQCALRAFKILDPFYSAEFTRLCVARTFQANIYRRIISCVGYYLYNLLDLFYLNPIVIFFFFCIFNFHNFNLI